MNVISVLKHSLISMVSTEVHLLSEHKFEWVCISVEYEASECKHMC